MPLPVLPSVYSLVVTGSDPFARAKAQACERVEDGLLVLADRADRLLLALLLEPDRPRSSSLLVFYAHANAVGDALAALLPPLLPVTFGWPASVLVDGANVGRLRLAIADCGGSEVPPWLVLGIELELAGGPGEPGERPEQAGLAELGALDLDPARLTEAWSRHFLTWLERFEREGFEPVRLVWNARCHDRGRRIELHLGGQIYAGAVVGLDGEGALRIGAGRVPLEAALAELA